MTATADMLHPVIIPDTLTPTLPDLPPSRADIQSVEVGYSLLAALGMVALGSLASFDATWDGAVATPLATAARQLSSDPGLRGA